MQIIEIKALKNGAHRNQEGNFNTVPKGYAVIPEDMKTPNFPFGEIWVEEVNGVMTVTRWIPGEIPESQPIPEPEPAAEDDIDAMIVDHEYRLLLLELGVSE